MVKKYSRFIKEMPLPQTWDRRPFLLPGHYTTKNFIQALLYARERSKFVARGSSRATFKIDYEGRPTILKMAMNKAGLAQNEQDVKILFDGVLGKNPLVIPGIDYDTDNRQPLWIHQEFASKATEADFVRETGASVFYLPGIIRTLRYDGAAETQQSYREANIESPLIQNLYELWAYLDYDDAFPNDLRNISNWGKFNGHLVIVDLGFSEDVRMQHYNVFDRPVVPKGWMRPKRKPAQKKDTPLLDK